MEALGDLAKSDLDAVLKRVIFIEVEKCVVPARAVQQFKGKRSKGLSEAMIEMWGARGADTTSATLTPASDGTLPLFRMELNIHPMFANM